MESNSLKNPTELPLYQLIGKTKFLILILVYSILTSGFVCPQQDPEPPEGFMAGQATRVPNSGESGLLFYLSGSKGFTADFAAGGQVLPNYLKDVKIISNGAKGPGFSADDSQLLTYWAPGNIFAQRGTLSFFWRSGYPVGSTPFPIFRVGYADHSSWDRVWLRIDNNSSGFDAFVTDIGLARTRVSYYMDKLPGPDEWIHLALSWDETEGIRFYVNGKLVTRQSASGSVYDTGLDQFGSHSRIISPYQVQSSDEAMEHYMLLCNLFGKYDRAIEIINTRHFHSYEAFEGGMHVKWTDAHIQKSRQYYNSKKYDKALEYFKKAQEFPENLDLVRDAKTWAVYYYIGLCYRQMNNKEKADENFNLCINACNPE